MPASRHSALALGLAATIVGAALVAGSPIGRPMSSLRAVARIGAPLSANAAAAPPKASAPTTAAATATLASIERDVEQLRQVSPSRDVRPTFLDQADFDAELARTPAEPSSAADDRRLTTIMGALGVWLPGLSDRGTSDSGDVRVLGFYRPSDQRLFVLDADGQLGARAQATFAHEYTHALQDQRFDLLRRISDPVASTTTSADTLEAWQALIEGDATFIEHEWVHKHLLQVLGQPDGLEVLAQADVLSESGGSFVNRISLFPYTDGLQFVTRLEKAGGPSAVDDAFDHPPVSTEQILHFDKWLAHEAPQHVAIPTDVLARLGPGWTADGAPMTLGELDLREWLIAEGIPAASAADAADGWGGDSLQLYRGPNNAFVVVDLITWDSVEEIGAFARRADTALERGPDSGAVVWTFNATALCIASDAATLALARAAVTPAL